MKLGSRSISGHQKVVAEQSDGKSPSNDAGPAQPSICMVCVATCQNKYHSVVSTLISPVIKGLLIHYQSDENIFISAPTHLNIKHVHTEKKPCPECGVLVRNLEAHTSPRFTHQMTRGDISACGGKDFIAIGALKSIE